MQCVRFLQIGYPSSNCKKINTNPDINKESDYDKSNISKSGKSTKTNKAASIMKLHNSRIIMKKSFTTLNTKVEKMEIEDSDLINSDDDSE